MLACHSISFFLLLTIPLLKIGSSVDSKLSSKLINPSINSSTVYCTEGNIQFQMSLKEPFYGALRVYDSLEPECMSQGNGSHHIKLGFRTDQCGTMTKIVDGRLRYDTVLYLQFHLHLMAPHDYKFNVLCSPFPQKLTLTTQFLNNKLSRHVTSEESKVVEGTPTMESKTSVKKMEKTAKVEDTTKETTYIEEKPKKTLEMEGKQEEISKVMSKTSVKRMEDTEQDNFNNAEWKNLSNPEYDMVVFKEGTKEPEVTSKQNVYVGEYMKMLVKVKLIPGVDSEVTDCIANDGTSLVHYPLIDADGCAVNPNIMPAFEVKIDSKINHKIFYNHYQAFRFFFRSTVQVICSIGFCNDTCPKPNCNDRNRWNNTERLKVEKKLVYYSYDVSFDEIKSSALGGEIKVQEYQKVFKRNSTPTGKTEPESLVNESKACISYIHFIIMVLFLLVVLLISIVITICMCVSANELKRRIMKPVPYGKFHDTS